MQNKLIKIMLSICAVSLAVGLGYVGFINAGSKQSTNIKQAAAKAENASSLKPSPSKYEPRNDTIEEIADNWEQWGDRFDSVEEAITKRDVNLKVLIPSYTKGQKILGVYVEKAYPGEVDQKDRAVIMLYDGKLTVSAYPDPSTAVEQETHIKQYVNESNKEASSKQGSMYSLVKVHGKMGSVVGKHSIKGPGGRELIDPGNLAWWEDNVTYSVICPEADVKELVEIAESMKQ